MRSVKMGIALAAMAGLLVGCGGATPEATGPDVSRPAPPFPRSTPVVEEVTPVADTPVPAPAPPGAGASQPAAPARRPAASPSGPTAPAPAPSPAIPDSPAAPEYPTAGRSCEDDLERVDGLGALGVDCQTASRVAAGYDAEVMGTGTFPEDAPLEVGDGWRCSSAVAEGSGESFSVGCDRGERRMEAVSFTWGV